MRSGTFGARGNIILMNWIYGSTSVGSLLSELRCLTWNSDLKLGLLLKAGFSAECRCLPAKLQPKRFHSIATFPWKHLNSLSTFLFNWKLSHALSCSSKPTQDASGGTQFWADAKPGCSKPRYRRLYPWLSFLESLFRVKGFKTAFRKWALQPAFLGESMHFSDCQSCDAMQEGVQGGGRRDADTAQLWNLAVRTFSWSRDLGLKSLPCPATEAATRGISSTFCDSCIQISSCAHEVSSLRLIADTVQVEASPSSTKVQQR